MSINSNSLNNLKSNYSKWNNSDTVAVRIPQVLKDQILTYARELDNGKVSLSGNLQDEILTIISKIENKEKGYKSNSASHLIRDLLNLSKSTVQ